MNGRSKHTEDDPEWGFLEGLWQRAPVESAVPAALQAYVHREEWRMRFWAVTDWLGVAACMVWGIVELATLTDNAGVLRGFLLVSLPAVALLFSLRLRRGLWAPAAESTRAYLAISQARIHASWWCLRLAWFLFVFQVLLLLGIQVAVHLDVTDFQWTNNPLRLILAIVVLSIVFVAWSVWYARTLRNREAALTTLRSELEEANSETSL